MLRSTFWVVLLVACKNPEELDSDGDGLMDSQEVELGLDPNKADTDGDGLEDGEELELGTDPKLPDTDDDGLGDQEELELGTSPLLADTDADLLSDSQELDETGTDPQLFDTDEDTYGDGLEVNEGYDPLDKQSRFYKGFWPYNPDKDSMSDPGFDGTALEVGEVFGRITNSVDQYGEQVDIYDFAGTDKLIVIDASATWCEACIKTASWLSGGPDEYSYEPLYSDVRRAMNQGRFHWLTFITDAFGEEDLQDIERWHEEFPHDYVAVLTDPDEHVYMALNVGTSYSGEEYNQFPSFLVLNGEMEVVVRGFAWDALQYLLDELEANGEI
jgi:hypothetical protein